MVKMAGELRPSGDSQLVLFCPRCRRFPRAMAMAPLPDPVPTVASITSCRRVSNASDNVRKCDVVKAEIGEDV